MCELQQVGKDNDCPPKMGRVSVDVHLMWPHHVTIPRLNQENTFPTPYTHAFPVMRLEIRRITPLDPFKLRTTVSCHINTYPRSTHSISRPPSRDISSKPKTPPILPLLCQTLLLVWWLSWVCHACWVFHLHNPPLRLWALGSVWVRTSFEVDRGLFDGFIPQLLLRFLWFFRQTADLFRQIRTFPHLFDCAQIWGILESDKLWEIQCWQVAYGKHESW